MKITLSTNDSINTLMADTNAHWTRAEATAIVTYLEELEADTGSDLELDAVAIRCEYAAYPTTLDAALAYGFNPDDGQDPTDWIESRTTVLYTTEDGTGSILIQQF